MPTKFKWRVTVRQDAFINYEAVVEAENEDQAVAIARDAWTGNNPTNVKFEEVGRDLFDHFECKAPNDVAVEPDDETEEAETTDIDDVVNPSSN